MDASATQIRRILLLVKSIVRSVSLAALYFYLSWQIAKALGDELILLADPSIPILKP